jgi:hypothetical protein
MQTCVKDFGGPDDPGVLSFIAQIAQFSRKDVEVDLFWLERTTSDFWPFISSEGVGQCLE